MAENCISKLFSQSKEVDDENDGMI